MCNDCGLRIHAGSWLLAASSKVRTIRALRRSIENRFDDSKRTGACRAAVFIARDILATRTDVAMRRAIAVGL